MAEREPGPEQARDLLAQLAAAREAFRAEVAAHEAAKARSAARAARTKALHAEARAGKKRLKALYGRFLRHMKRKWAAERLAVDADRRAVADERAAADRIAEEAREYQRQLFASWEQLTEGQRRLLAERRQAEAWLAAQTDALDHRAATVAEHERQYAAGRADLESRLDALHGEVVGLDERAANARATVEQLELRQNRLLVPADGFAEPMSVAMVPLASSLAVAGIPPTDADGLLTDLHARQQDLDRVRRKIFAARDELARQSTTLDDQRAVLSEQVAALVAARELWNAAELSTLGELESVATAIRGRERGLDVREQQLIEAERLSRDREADLWALRERLDGWRRAFAAHEAASVAVRDQHWAALAAERKRLGWKEEQLAEVSQAWAAIRERERADFAAVVEHLNEERERCAEATAAAERDRERYAAELARVAAGELALEEARSAPDAPADRKLRILGTRWEKRFRGWEKQVAGERERLHRTAADADRLRGGLEDAMAKWLDGRAAVADRRIQLDRERLSGLLAEDAATVALPEAAEREIERLRGELDRLSEMLVGPGQPALAAG